MKRKRSSLDSIGGLNMAHCGRLHNNCGENTSPNKFGRKVITEKEELHYDHPPIEKTLLLFVIHLL
jgi:hypothetical protein